MNPNSRFHAAVGMAIVAATFSAVVAGMMIFNYLRLIEARPLNAPALTALKETLRRNPADRTLKEQIRELDWRLRAEFFERQRISGAGSRLLLAGCLVFVTVAGAAAAFQARRPHPGPQSSPRAEWLSMRRDSRLALGAAGAALGGLAGVLVMTNSLRLPPPPRLHPTSPASPPAAAPVPSDHPVSPTDPSEPQPWPVAAGYPAWAEVQSNWPSFRGPGGLGIASGTN